MSNTLAIATVTAVLQARITALLAAHSLSGMDVSTTHPVTDPDPGVYIKLYRIVPHPHMRNLDLPTRREDGGIATRPRLAVELHYLISFVGDPGSFDAERLAGLVMTDLHAVPVLTQASIRDFVDGLAPDHVLARADLGDQLERVHFTPESLDLENLARLWTMLNQSFYGLSVSYQASVVLLDADVRVHQALPVAATGVTVVPGVAARLRSAHAEGSTQPIVAMGQTLVIEGSGLRGPTTWLRIAGRMFEVPATAIRPGSIAFPLTPATNLRAGVVAVQVVHRIDVDPSSAVDLREGPESNALAIAIVPTVTPGVVTAVGSGRFDVRLGVTPAPEVGQELEIQLSALGGTARTSSALWRLDGGDVVFTVVGLSAGDWLVRVRVDGASSIPTLGAGGSYDQPRVTVP